MSSDNTAGTALIADYLKDLERAARALPKARRRELVDDVRSHIEVTLAESGRTGPDAVRDVLAALGGPDEIVSAALPGEADSAPAALSRGITGLEITALVLLLFGAAAIGLGWLAGVMLLWASPRWTRGEKALGTLVLPGGLILPAVFAATLAGGGTVGSLSFFAIGMAAPLITAAYLFHRARTASVAGGAARWTAGAWAVGAVVVAVPAVGALFFLTSSTEQGGITPATVTSPTSVAPTHMPS